jgi:hypothetical protein
MRILYLSCHSILEYDEVKMLHNLGHYVFSAGAYLDPQNPGDGMRPPLDGVVCDPADVAAWHEIPCTAGKDRRSCLTKSFVNRFDLVIVMHLPEWIESNWRAMSDRPVIWRTIGQSITGIESRLAKYRQEGMKIVRYSPREKLIPGYIGGDATIRFGKDPAEFAAWNGEENYAITFNQSLPLRGPACNWPLWLDVVRDLPAKLYGPGNEGAGPWNQGMVSYETLKRAMQDNRAYFYVGTHPASYTLNFIEAWMSGIPVVAVGRNHGNMPGYNLYEVADLIQSGVNGFIGHDAYELRKMLRNLLNDPVLAKRVGEAGRKSATTIFGAEVVAADWRKFLSTLSV